MDREDKATTIIMPLCALIIAYLVSDLAPAAIGSALAVVLSIQCQKEDMGVRFESGARRLRRLGLYGLAALRIIR
jgi:hypothetical protein